MKYKNPRLKHVKKIRMYAEKISGYYSEKIVDQCNLLLETKKRKKCTCYYAGTISTPLIRVDNTNCPKHGKRVDTSILGTAKDLLQNQKEEFKPSPQPEKKCNCETNYEFEPCPVHPSSQPEIEKLSDVIKIDTTDKEFIICLAEKVDELIDHLNIINKKIK